MSGQGFAGPAPLIASTWLLIKLRGRRLANALTAGRKRAPKPGARRTGTAGKRSSQIVLYVFAPLMLFFFGTIARGAIFNLHEALDAPGSFWLSVEFSGALVAGIAFLLLVLWFASLLLTIASGELAKPDWDLEWLITLPIRVDTLLWARILERSVVNPSGIAALLPACTIVAWYSGLRWSAPLAGVLAAWPLLLLAALCRTLVDTGLRLSMAPARLRNLHAIISVLAIATMYLAMSTGMKGKSGFMLGIAASMPAWLAYTPMGLAVHALNVRGGGATLLWFGAFFVEVGVLLALGVALLRRQLSSGIVSVGARESGRPAPAAVVAAAATTAGVDRPRGFSLLSPVQRRELTLLARDRNFLVGSLVIPLLIVGGQILLGSSGVATTMWQDVNVLASVAFGLAAYSLSMSAFQTLNAEGHALWLLYTFPRPVDAVLKDKAKLWGVITLAYPLILFTIGAFLMPTLTWKFLGAVLTAFIGIPIYAFIGVALGVFGSNPLEQTQSQRVKPEYLYLYMGLSGLYIYAVVTPSLHQRLVFMMLTMLLAFALWQKARDQLPYLLDPDAAPPARVSTADGLMAAMLFFVIQGIATVVVGAPQRFRGAAVLVAFAIAGALTYGLMRWVYASAKAQGVPRMFGPTLRPLLGAGAGVCAAGGAAIYLLALRNTPLFTDAVRGDGAYAALGWWVLPLALVAAPIFEEFIFRGLIFGGLRRSFGLWPAALASAGLFAIFHPAIAIAPVFVLGLATAWVYDRSGSLLAPMMTHAFYNACVIGVQIYLL